MFPHFPSGITAKSDILGRGQRQKGKTMEKINAQAGATAFAGKMPTILEMLQAGVHFGHQKGRWHPKMAPYIFAERSGVHIIDLEKSAERLKIALDFTKATVASGNLVLFVGTKKQGQKIIETAAKECGMPYVNERWIGGLFTNFTNVSKLIKKLKDLTEKKEAGLLEKYTKKEQVEFNKEIVKLTKFVGGLSDLRKIPSAVFVLDLRKEKTAIAEARKKKVPIIALCDTNVNPELVTYPIPANDDAIKSIQLVAEMMVAAVKEGKELAVKNSSVIGS